MRSKPLVHSKDDIASLGTIVFVGAHPDDETMTAGGILALAAENGQQVICITATKGEAGTQDEQRWPRETLGKVRAQELETALRTLGVRTHHWLGFSDGGCASADANQAVAALQALFERYQPDTILTFGPDGLTGHDDHKTVSQWVDAAVSTLARQPAIYHAAISKTLHQTHLQAIDQQLNMFFNIARPPLVDEAQCALCVTLPPRVRDKKYQALQDMPSQMGRLCEQFEKPFLQDAFGVEVFVQETSGQE